MTSFVARATVVGQDSFKLNCISEGMKEAIIIIKKLLGVKLSIKKRIFNKNWISSRAVFGLSPRQLYSVYLALTSNNLTRLTKIESVLFNETIKSQN